MYKNNKKQFPGENFFIPALDYARQYLPIDTKIVLRYRVFYLERPSMYGARVME